MTVNEAFERVELLISEDYHRGNITLDDDEFCDLLFGRKSRATFLEETCENLLAIWEGYEANEPADESEEERLTTAIKIVLENLPQFEDAVCVIHSKKENKNEN